MDRSCSGDAVSSVCWCNSAFCPHDSIQAEKIDTQTIVVWLKGVTDIFFVASLSIQKSRDDVRPLLSESDYYGSELRNPYLE